MATRKNWLYDANMNMPRRTKYRRKTEPKHDDTSSMDINSAFAAANDRSYIPRCQTSSSTIQDIRSVDESSNQTFHYGNFAEYAQYCEEAHNGCNEDFSESQSTRSVAEADSEENMDTSSTPDNASCENEPVEELPKTDSNVLDFTVLFAAYCHRYRLSDAAIESLLQLFHLSFKLTDDEKYKLPNSVYKLKKRSNAISTFDPQLCWICTQCSLPIYCKFDDRKTPNEYSSCERCNITASSTDNYFVSISIEKTLGFLLNNDADVQLAATTTCGHKSDIIFDVCCGSVHKKIANKNQTNNTDERSSFLTVMFNTDGAPVFSSSRCSIWPILLTINEPAIVINDQDDIYFAMFPNLVEYRD